MSGRMSKTNKSVPPDKGECVLKEQWKDGLCEGDLSGKDLTEQKVSDKSPGSKNKTGKDTGKENLPGEDLSADISMDKDFLKKQLSDKIHAVQEIMESSGTVLTKDEITGYLQPLPLSEQQINMVCQYLSEQQSYTNTLSAADRDNRDTIQVHPAGRHADRRQPAADTPFPGMYQQDLSRIVPCTKEEENRLYEQLLTGSSNALQQLSEQWTHKVLKIARSKTATADMDPKEFADMIQEGNMGVLIALQQMSVSGKKTDFEQELTAAAESAMEMYVQKIYAAADMDQSLLAKAALVYEAQCYLVRQLQRIPSVEELARYTKIPVPELEDILALLEEKK